MSPDESPCGLGGSSSFTPQDRRLSHFKKFRYDHPLSALRSFWPKDRLIWPMDPLLLTWIVCFRPGSSAFDPTPFEIGNRGQMTERPNDRLLFAIKYSRSRSYTFNQDRIFSVLQLVVLLFSHKNVPRFTKVHRGILTGSPVIHKYTDWKVYYRIISQYRKLLVIIVLNYS